MFFSFDILFEGLSNLYVITTATVLLAVLIAFYCANFLKDENEIGKEISPEIPPDSVDDDDDEEVFEQDGDGIVSKLKTARLKVLEAQLSRDQLEEERRIEKEQLSAIYELLKKQESELHTKELDEEELSAQLNLYR